ncbi:hypothetical protein F2P56_024459 [Juglans regia]|uniref:Reverse transcriptase Ty1/copia-type domain-containing protein n=2 Tax=Juglans regia TaxID=51240 RepID=A0A833X0P9_JUGRE|nr:uncharacterized mitochondrial protein AtMg00820-like [Juglans regia]KAF5454822.1 hypothetical protein F2P56_024459 [Juglans regia]
MVTCTQAGIRKPNLKYAHYHTVVDFPKEPKRIRSALNHAGWNKALQDEIQALEDNNTWTLVPRSPHMDVIGCKWVVKTKINADGTVNRSKAHLVIKDFHQTDGVNYNQARHYPDHSQYCPCSPLGYSPTRCQECLPLY